MRWLKDQKQAGQPISTPFYLIDYYERALRTASRSTGPARRGNKCFYVSAEGNFQYCYHVPSTRNLMDMTREDIAGNRGKKGCEENCGVDCVIHTSLPFSNRTEIVAAEVQRRVSKYLPVLRR